jgi:hypothetical protein
MTAVSMVAVSGFAALAIDVGMVYNVRTELQRTADAAALAGAAQLLDQDRLMGATNYADDLVAAQQAVQSVGSLNQVYNANPQILAQDIRIGYLSNPTNLSEAINFNNPSEYNTVQVVVRRDSAANGPVSLFFARIFGLDTATVIATAAATLKDGVVGYRVTEETGNAKLAPFALSLDYWNRLLARTYTTGDHYAYDPDTGSVSAGADGLYEMNLYPGDGPDQLPPGNFGTVNIGPNINSTATLCRQILEGVSQEDLAYYGGELKLGSDGTLILSGDTGLSAGLKDEVKSIIGQARSIPLFREVVNPGNTAQFTIVGFAGVRILDVKLTGALTLKRLDIQPAYVIDGSVITESGSGPSFFVYAPQRLCR